MENLFSSSSIKMLIRDWKGYSRIMEGMAVYYWPKVIGPSLAEKTMAERVRGGILWVKTDDSALAHQLSLFSSKIVQEYRRFLGEGVVKSVRFTIGHVPIRDEVDGEYKKSLKSSNTPLSPHIIESAENIKDPELRSRFMSLVQKSENRRTFLINKGWKTCHCGIMTEDGDTCPFCRRKEQEEIHSELCFMLKRNPCTKWEEANKNIPRSNIKDYNKAKHIVKQKIEESLMLGSKEMRRGIRKNKDFLVKLGIEFMQLGGDEKKLIHLVGIDIWKKIGSIINDGITKNSGN